MSRVPAPQPATAAIAAPVAFAYGPGTYRYAVTSEATIEQSPDGGQSAGRSESRTTVAYVTYSVGGRRGPGTRLVSGSVDSFTVNPPPAGVAAAAGGGMIGGAPLIAAPLAFRGAIDPVRRRVDLRPAAAAPVAADCGSPNQAALALAREAFVVAPATLATGQTWTDSSVSTICRGDVPLTTRATHVYRVAGVASYAGVEALRLTRATTLALSGQGAQRGLSFTVTGRGTGSADLYLDAAAGRFLGGTSESNVELEVAVPGSAPQRFRQRGRGEIAVGR
ncbi:MAG: hypothetical protein ACJ79S_06275 [Gemmatimonadaceae bacterium]